MPGVLQTRQCMQAKTPKNPPRSVKAGVECLDRLEWHNWKVGDGVTQNLSLKNVGRDVITLTYKLPADRQFILAYPDPVKLYPGVSHTVQVTFKPKRHQDIRDVLWFRAGNKEFSVSLIAPHKPTTDLQIPADVDLGYMAVSSLCTRTFTMQNNSSVHLPFQWEVQTPFLLSPAEGRLAPGQSAIVTLACKPKEARVWREIATCRTPDKTYQLKITGISKRGCMSLSEANIDFGDILEAQRLKRWVTLTNTSPVPVKFCVSPSTSGEADAAFTLSPTSGVLAPREAREIKVTYAPFVTGVDHCDTFVFGAPSANEVTLVVKGRAVQPRVVLTPSSIEFGSHPIGSSVTRTMRLANMSNIPIIYNFDGAANGAFCLESSKGVISAQSHRDITVRFQGWAPANFWKRLICHVKGGKPVGIDLLGCAYSEDMRPSPLSRGLLDGYLDMSCPQASQLGLQGPSPGHHGGHSMQDIPFLGPDPWRAVTVSTEDIHFPPVSLRSGPQSIAFTVSNHTAAILTVIAALPKHALAADRQFQVHPSEVDVRPHGTATFHVSFVPSANMPHSSSMIEVVAFVSNMRNFRLVDASDLLPPWSFTVQVTGRTMQTVAANSDGTLEPRTIVFPPTLCGESAYQHALLHNEGDLPLFFEVNTALLPSTVTCKPLRGIVEPKTWQLLALRFYSTCPVDEAAELQCTLNGSKGHTLTVPMRASACEPALAIEGGGAVYFKPTGLGSSSKRQMKLQNMSRVPLDFKLLCPVTLEDFFQVEPACGTLLGLQSTEVTWTFHPSAERVHKCQATCAFSGSSTSSQAKEKQIDIFLKGEGTPPDLVLEPALLDFGTIPVGQKTSRTLLLRNRSRGCLRYHLDCTIHPTANGADRVSTPEVAVDVDNAEGSLPGYSNTTITVSLTPQQRGACRVNLCLVSNTASSAKSGNPPAQGQDASNQTGTVLNQSLATCIASAAFPSLTVSDIARDGHLKHRVWREARVTALNAELASDLSEVELKLRTSMRDGTFTTKAAIDALPAHDISIGVCSFGTELQTIYMQITNPGFLDVEWELQGQNDVGGAIERENWLEASKPLTQAERLQEFIISSKILDVSPRSGQLRPKESSVIEFTSHMELDASDFCRDLGRKQIGDMQSETRTFLVHNTGPAPVPYEIDVEPLRNSVRENYGFEVFTLEAPWNGTVAPHSALPLNLSFTPLEAKPYTLELPLAYGDGQTALLKFHGEGVQSEPCTLQAGDTAGDATQTTCCAGLAANALTPRSWLGCLSHGAVNLGSIPPSGTGWGAVTLRNLSGKRLNFDWSTVGVDAALLGGSSLAVKPQSGQLGSGETMLCRFCLSAGQKPHLLQGDMACTVSIVAEDPPTEEGICEGANEEEIIAQHPRASARVPQTRLRQAVHAAETISSQRLLPKASASHRNTEVDLATHEDAPVRYSTQVLRLAVEARVIDRRQDLLCPADNMEQDGVTAATSLEALLFFACQAACSALGPEDALPALPTLDDIRQGQAHCSTPHAQISISPAQAGGAPGPASMAHPEDMSVVHGHGTSGGYPSDVDHDAELPGFDSVMGENLCQAIVQGSGQTMAESQQGLRTLETVLEDALASVLQEVVLTR